MDFLAEGRRSNGCHLVNSHEDGEDLRSCRDHVDPRLFLYSCVHRNPTKSKFGITRGTLGMFTLVYDTRP
jgi:hypothetical protein